MRQNVKRRKRNFPLRSELKSLIKRELMLIKEGKVADAEKFLAKVYSTIDTACKKNIIHPNNAARKKSRLARELNKAQGKGNVKVAAPATEKAEKEETKA